MTRPASRPKYGNRKVSLDGFTFDSKAEARRYGELRMLEQAGKIEGLEVHPVYKLEAFTPVGIGAQKIGRYTADFTYVENGKETVEDVKSKATRRATDYRLRIRIFKANYPHLKFVETL